MTWTFEPRFSFYDNADSLERHLISRWRKETKPVPSTRMAEHIERLAKLKTTNFLATHNCVDCQLPLDQHYKRVRCTTCLGKHEIAVREAANERRRTRKVRRINKAFVGHTVGPKPS